MLGFIFRQVAGGSGSSCQDDLELLERICSVGMEAKPTLCWDIGRPLCGTVYVKEIFTIV